MFTQFNRHIFQMGWNSTTNHFCWTASNFWDGVFWGLCDLSMFPAKTMVVCWSGPLVSSLHRDYPNKMLKRSQNNQKSRKNATKTRLDDGLGITNSSPQKMLKFRTYRPILPRFHQGNKNRVEDVYALQKRSWKPARTVTAGGKKKWHSSNWLILSWGSKLPFFPYNRG